MPPRDAPLSVEVPAAGADRPVWGKVGIVAVLGFIIGIGWPRLTNTRIAPSPPGDNAPPPPAEPGAHPAAVESAAGATSARSALVASAGAPATPPSASAERATTRTALVREQAPVVPVVGPGLILHCRDDAEDLSDCGSLPFDPVALPRIKALSHCPAARGASGKLSIGFEVDFRRKTVRVLLGKSTTLSHETAEALVRCADTSFDQVNLAEVPHDHRQYTLFYAARFADSPAAPSNDRPVVDAPTAGTTTSESPASGSATVAWDVALMRDTPKSGAIVARVLRGSKVKVLAHQGEWYRVQYGAFQGWVYRGTLGL